ncbi:unnamed protein product [Acanthoscelides obtectus]|uniref:Secreted protein n=1 Tax=Acanthoscelides obtectus TaxID=200917 RepID=A0A9P0NXP0_ACAOB|nr:unnamed protein product [Acanthoscelides obtectus]CAK1647984.1 hypothetical protein AOBTE_LOCUS15487 [Acanthoscelides obtectus]
MKLIVTFYILLLVGVLVTVECKRGGGSRGGSSRGKSGTQTGQAAAPPPAPESGFKKQSVNTQHQSAPASGQQKPYGWNVPGTNHQPGAAAGGAAASGGVWKTGHGQAGTGNKRVEE